jgi:ABC-type molybdenum transport system ATPase subunit/photorepair protein PhrA
MIQVESGPRNLFEVDNARYLTREDVVRTFVPTPSFWRLLSAKNHIVLGARGSGKTAILRMLSHDHLSKWDDERANELIEAKGFIGIYVPTKVGWVGSLQTKPWESGEEKEQLFRWRLNVSSCTALIAAIESCLQRYFKDEKRRIEQRGKADGKHIH